MMKNSIKPACLIAAFLVCAGTSHVSAQQAKAAPQVGYLYPSGAAAGSTVEILAGGQLLRNAHGVRVSGQGVTARVIRTYKPSRNLDQDERALLKWRVASRRAELQGRPAPERPAPPPGPDGKIPEVKLPDLPFLDIIDTLDEVAIEHAMMVFQRQDRQQPSPQLGEFARIEVKVAPGTAPGLREMRLVGPQGLSNPMRFEVGNLPEVREAEPNEPTSKHRSSAGGVVSAPCTFNGQIQSGDVDTFRFRARRGAELVVRGRARALIPYLADAVPGWFQMVITVRDANGKELAYGDDFRFDPDPVFAFRIQDDGEYVLEVRDAIFRGREDFVYRIHVGELPYVGAIYPLGGRAGEPLSVETRGWNLSGARTVLDTSPGGPEQRMFRFAGKSVGPVDIPYAVGSYPEILEAEPSNNNSATAPAVVLPVTINGRIGRPGDTDVVRIDGRKGEQVVARVKARSLRSPLDAVLHVSDAQGKVLAWSDDVMEKDGHLHLGDGLLTHHADPEVALTVPADGPIFVRIADTQAQGGPDHAYRLTIELARPDFELRVVPSAVNVQPGGQATFKVLVRRSGGFDGEIELACEGAPEGFRWSGTRIPAGEDLASVTLHADVGTPAGVVALRWIGTARADGREIVRTATPADDRMQAFLWRHLVPAAEWLVVVSGGPQGGGKAGKFEKRKKAFPPTKKSSKP